MPHRRQSKYVWPASSITRADMALVYAVRESTRPRTSISQLIAQAVRQQYGQVSVQDLSVPFPQDKRKVA